MINLNLFNKFGESFFSQSDEDGLTLEIVKRLQINSGYFLELGSGPGLENNTLILLMHGWRGIWVDLPETEFLINSHKNLKVINKKINLSNIIEIFNEQKLFDLISIDIDGNDYHILNYILSNNIRPKIFIIEYNGAFPPPIQFIMPYDENHLWSGTNYFGCSLTSLNLLMEKHNYYLICCNEISGANAFFVNLEYFEKEMFPDVSSDLEDKFIPLKPFNIQKNRFVMDSRTLNLFT